MNVDALVSMSLSDPMREKTWWVSLKLAYSRTKIYHIHLITKYLLEQNNQSGPLFEVKQLVSCK